MDAYLHWIRIRHVSHRIPSNSGLRKNKLLNLFTRTWWTNANTNRLMHGVRSQIYNFFFILVLFTGSYDDYTHSMGTLSICISIFLLSFDSSYCTVCINKYAMFVYRAGFCIWTLDIVLVCTAHHSCKYTCFPGDVMVCKYSRNIDLIFFCIQGQVCDRRNVLIKWQKKKFFSC